jgi:hypothetical protein
MLRVRGYDDQRMKPTLAEIPELLTSSQPPVALPDPLEAATDELCLHCTFQAVA